LRNELTTDLTAAAQLDPNNESIQDELARLEFAEKKVLVCTQG